MPPSVPQHKVSTGCGEVCSSPASALRISVVRDFASTPPRLAMARRAKADPGRAVAPLARPKRYIGDAQIRPSMACLVVARILKRHAFRGGFRELVALGRCRQASERIGEARRAMRHAV